MRISIGKSRKDTRWKVEQLTWYELCDRLSKTFRTSETVNEYKAMNANARAEKKDVGGFVGGVIVNGRRNKNNTTSRSLVTLDADFATPQSWDNITLLYDFTMCCYSTHSHTKKAPRLRYVIPLDREVTPDEYEPIARRLAQMFGIDQFDVTTYETCRLMYWPSTSRDGEFFFDKIDGDYISADELLGTYLDWHDTTEWPLGSTEQAVRVKQAKAQGDPMSKPGLVGAFCRTYDIPTAIETFLSDVYEPCQEENRYTYTEGSTSAGVVLYQNGTFSYSHHSTDPAGGILCNSFDLVRLHKFGDLDEKVDRDTPINKRPSYKAMCDFAKDDPNVKVAVVTEKRASAKEAFRESCEETEDEPNDNWIEMLTMTEKAEVVPSAVNIDIILENDPNLKGSIAYNELRNTPCLIDDTPWHKCHDKKNGDPWSDADLASLSLYIEDTYKVYNLPKLTSVLDAVLSRHKFHPIRKYLKSLEWDGTKRIETLFHLYLGAEDSEYTRAVSKKWFTAAVTRVMRPGCKFDNLIVLVGAQGVGKSYLGNLLGKGWFSDTFTTMQGKEAYEQLNGCWIVEIAELSAMKRAEVESVKMFISKQEDTYRGAYRRYSATNKRQCVFYGTTNDDSFLRDRTGNRRFWPIGVDKSLAQFDIFSLTSEDIDQLWAEAVTYYEAGEPLHLSGDLVAQAVKEQEAYTLLDPRQGMIEEYLDKLLPVNWEDLPKQRRREYIQGVNFSDSLEGTVQRTKISVVEMAYELFGEEVLQPFQAKEYHNILKGLSGWKCAKSALRSIYGKQRTYVRIGVEDEEDEEGLLD